LIKEFNAFYQQCSILREENKAQRQLRLDLTRMVGTTVKNGMQLLGIGMPERM
jgi:arginyl-tRNA synthetase